MAKRKMSIQVADILTRKVCEQLWQKHQQEFEKNKNKIENSKEFKQLKALYKKYIESNNSFKEANTKFQEKTGYQVQTCYNSSEISLHSNKYGFHIVGDVKNTILLQDFASEGEFDVEEFVNKLVKQYQTK